MKKYLLIAAIAIVSCKKESAQSNCLPCKIGVNGGVPGRDTTLCGDLNRSIYDENGNELPFYCP